ncbi:MAG TPA: Trk system potassium transporter TrkA, partial [Rubrobacter sp.]|nr:Trk system potassium transporter TrkA [Rubrobacter sp.]
SREGHRVVAVEQDEALVEHASQQLDALVMQGNGASPKVLREAGIEDSDLLVAVTSTDEVNIVACLAAKAQGVARTVARVHSSDYYDKKEPFARDLLGIDLVISTEHMAAKEIRESLLVPGAVNVESFAGGSIDVVEVILKKGSPAVDRPVREVELPEQSLIVGVVRDGEALVPRGDTVLHSRDHIFLVCRQRDVNEVVGAVATDTEPVDDVMILGAGRIGLLLALALEEIGISVKVIEKAAARARLAASKLRKALVLHDEGVSREFLLQERVDKTDAFVAVTGDDRTNLLAAMNARRLGSRMTIAGISRGEFAPLAEALGVDVTVSPRLLAAGAILRFVRRGEVAAVFLMESGAQMIELGVPEGCRAAGRSLAQVDFPEGAIVGAVARGGEVLIPTGRDVLRAGDKVVVFTVEAAVDEVERLFAT